MRALCFSLKRQTRWSGTQLMTDSRSHTSPFGGFKAQRKVFVASGRIEVHAPIPMPHAPREAAP